MRICGIDEAGRGCIIGSLVICGVTIDEGQEQELKAAGARDSKLLTPAQRQTIYNKIIKIAKGYHCEIIPPAEIDLAVLSDFTNLNWLEADKGAKIVEKLKPDHVIMDCPSPNTKAFKEYISERLSSKPSLVCAHHADATFVVVGAASIIAKVTRDRLIEEIKKEIGIDFGSGYMTDPKTTDFLEGFYDKYPDIFRKSWEPYRKMAMGRAQTDLNKY